MEMPIIKEEIDIDDAMIKLEYDQDSQSSLPPDAMEFSSCDELKIIEERPNMITVSLNDQKTEDERQFIDSLCLFNQTQSNATSYCKCEFCELTFENQLHLDAHTLNHRLNKHFCRHGCGICYDTLELCLEHEYRDHDDTLQFKSCRLCNFFVDNMNYNRMAKHMTTHFYMRRYVCALCRLHFETSQKRKLHWKSSKYICGQVEYMDAINIFSEMIAVSSLSNKQKQPTTSSESSVERSKLIGLLNDVEIKEEPIDINDEQNFHSPEIKIEPIDDDETRNISNQADKMIPSDKQALYEQKVSWLRDSATNIPTICTLRLPSFKQSNTEKTKTATSRAALPLIDSEVQKIFAPAPQQLTKPDLKSLTSTDNSNVLKVLSNNCMIVKLPANTKIMRITKPLPSSSLTIEPSSTSSTPMIVPSSGGSNLESTAKSGSSNIELTSQPHRRNILLNNNTVRIIDSLPESRKIIEDLQTQIRTIEKTLPLPGSVLHEPKRMKGELICKGTKSNDGQFQLSLSSFKLALKPENIEKLSTLSNIHGDYRFTWTCPFCPTLQYKYYIKLITHLKQKHDVPESKLQEITALVKPYKLSADPQAVEVSEQQPLEVQLVPGKVSSEIGGTSVAATQDKTQLNALKVKPQTAEAEQAKPSLEKVATVEQRQAHVSPKREEEQPETSVSSTTRIVPSSDSNRGQFECTECQKTFTTKGALRIHKLIHTGELPHQCNYCDKRFRTRGQVRVHHRRHTGEKPFKCKVCSLTFTHRETLISHLSRHIGMKRYKCYGCDQYFVVVSGLSAHRQQRPDTCGKVKFTARAHGPRVRVIKGEVVFEPHPEHNGYLRSEDPLAILSEIKQPQAKDKSAAVS